MKYHPPATSAYSQHQNAQLYPSGAKHGHGHRNASFIILYLLLKFWDKPLLQKVFRQVSNVWKDTTIQMSNENGNILLNGILTSGFGNRIGRGVKSSAFFLAQCLIQVVAVTKVDKVGLLEVPRGIQSWVQNQSQLQDNSNGANEKVSVDNVSQTAFHITEKNEEGGTGISIGTGISEIVENHKKIYLVLKYWFGQYTPDISQKQLWMIASSSVEHMERIDAEIYNEFGDLLMELSESSKCDSNGRATLAGHNENNLILYGWRGKLAAIIVLDQMSRHIHRHLSKSRNDTQRVKLIPEQKTLDALAHDIAHEFQSIHADEISCGMIPTPMMIFALMPLRHRSTIQSVGFVQNKVEDIGSLNGIDMDNMIRRFRRATNRRMAVLQDEARREGKQTRYQALGEGENSIAEEKKQAFSEDDILEFHYFEANMSDADRTPIIRTIKQYIEGRGINPSRSKNNVSDEEIIRDYPVIVSLSGGVDSMVIASALAYLRDQCDFKRLYIVAVHIDYGNRPESAAEAAFVEYYARDILKLDHCTVRRINEVTRGVTKRDEYEKISRNLRYDLYRQAVAECIEKCHAVDPAANPEVGVMLGHHRGDVVENVISNSNKGCGPLDLSGMTSLSKNDGVTIYRPLLPLEKTDVYDFSHKYGVPYFKDTTPHWSTRGKLRNKLIPLLEEIYGDGCLHNLASLAEESDQAWDLFQNVSFRPFMEKVQRYPMGLIFSTREFSHQGSYFWKIVLREMLHSAGLGMFGDKATTSFLERVFAKKMTPGWLQCRKDYAVYLMEDGRVAILYPDSFPWRKADQFGSIGKAVPYGEKVLNGPWELSAEVTPNAEIKEVFGSWEEFMSGKLQYCLEVPASTDDCSSVHQQEVGSGGLLAPLEFVESFNKQSRPLSWKGFDLKIQATLPLLGIGKDALNSWIPGEKTVIVTVKMMVKRDGMQ